MNKEEVEKLIKKLSKVKRVEPVGHKAYDLVSPVRIGDVLQRLLNEKTIVECERIIARLIGMWHYLGIDQSLQEIDGRSEYHVDNAICEICEACGASGDEDCKDGCVNNRANKYLDNPQAEELFEFLYTIFN